LRRPVATYQLKHFERNQATFPIDVDAGSFRLRAKRYGETSTKLEERSRAGAAESSHRSPFASHVPAFNETESDAVATVVLQTEGEAVIKRGSSAPW
jgi:hypothetical protein